MNISIISLKLFTIESQGIFQWQNTPRYCPILLSNWKCLLFILNEIWLPLIHLRLTFMHEQVGILFHFFHMDNQLSHYHLLNILSFSQSYASQDKNKISICLHTLTCSLSLDFSFDSTRELCKHSKLWYLERQVPQTFSFFLEYLDFLSFIHWISVYFKMFFMSKWFYFVYNTYA